MLSSNAGGFVLLSVKSTLLALDFNTNVVKPVVIEIKGENINKGNILATGVSRDSSRLSIINDNKQLITCVKSNDLYVEDSITNLKRRASCVAVSGEHKCVFVGEKSGYVYQFGFTPQENAVIEDEEGSSCILGHASMLSTMIISPDSKYITSGDRDGKIRISRVQQPFVIENICLGHTRFITDLANMSSLLISIGGDNFLRVWSFPDGDHRGCIDLSEYITEFLADEKADNSSDSIYCPSRVHCTEQGLCFVSFSGAPFLLQISITLSKTNSDVVLNDILKMELPNEIPLVDSTLCKLPSGNYIVIGVQHDQQKKSSCIVKFEIDFSHQCSIKPVVSAIKELDVALPPNLFEDFQVYEDTRENLLKSLNKSDRDKIEQNIYFANKEEHHKNILERRLRHQRLRTKTKRQANRQKEG